MAFSNTQFDGDGTPSKHEKAIPACIMVIISCSFRIILVCGVVFFLASAIISVARLYALKLYSPHTIIGWFSRNITAEDQQEVLKL